MSQMSIRRALLATSILLIVGSFQLSAVTGKKPSKQKWSGYDAPDGLELTISSETTVVSEPSNIILSWELENRTGAPIYVCQWPGITCNPYYDAPDGSINGVVSGYPDSKPLPRK